MRASVRRPKPLDETIRVRMLDTKRRDTEPELRLRSALHREGLRYRIDEVPLQGVRCRADVVFRRARVAVFVNGCFWHGCPLHATWPKNNAEWWRAKIEANRARDARVDATLTAAGWHVVRLWEHEDLEACATIVAELVRARVVAPRPDRADGEKPLRRTRSRP